MSSGVKILQLTLSFHSGGRREAIATLVRQLRREAVLSHLACLNDLGCPDEKLAGLFEGWQVLSPSENRRGASVRALRQLCRNHQIDVIHCHDAASQFLAAKAFWWSKRPPIVMTFHRSIGLDTARFRDRVRNAFAGLRCAAIVVGSQERWTHYTSENFIPKRKVICIPFGIEIGRFQGNDRAREQVRRELGIGPATVLVGMAGHFGAEKGLDVGLAAFAECVRGRSCDDMRMIVLGTGEPHRLASLRALAEPMGSRVQFLGFREDRESYFAAMDIFLHTPRLEAFGLVAAESMAIGLPVVATAVGGVAEQVRSEETGLLLPSEDVAGLAVALDRMANNPELRRVFGERGKKVARRDYSQEIYARRYIDLYQAVAIGLPIESWPPNQATPLLDRVL